jgi:hypothetical protein
MDELTAFERQIGGELGHEIGPTPSFDAMAIASVTATQSPKWRFQSMFSATKFVVAGVIVALFGGILLSGVLTQPSDETAPAVGASASAQAEPTDAMTATPGPTPARETNEPGVVTTRDDLLPGVELELLEVSPGILKILGDGPHNLTQNVWDIEITPNGEAWVEKHRVVYGPKQYRDDKIKRDYRNARVLSLGEPGAMRLPPDGAWPVRFYVDLDPQGDVHVSGTGSDGLVWRDGAWEEWDRPFYCEGLLSAEACWWYNDGAGFLRIDVADRSQRRFTHEDLGLEPEAGFGFRFARGDDGIVWTDSYDANRVATGEPDAAFTGLASYDGERWTTVEVDDPVPGHAEKLAVAPDGTVWVVLRDLKDDGGLTVVKWDGETRDTYGPVEGLGSNRDIHFASDGRIWFDAITFYDGDDLRQVEIPATLTSGDLRGGPHAFGPDGSVWVVLIDMRDPKSLGCEVDPPVCEGVAALYVITPEAVAAAE